MSAYFISDEETGRDGDTADAEQRAWERAYRIAARQALADGCNVNDAHVIAEAIADEEVAR